MVRANREHIGIAVNSHKKEAYKTLVLVCIL